MTLLRISKNVGSVSKMFAARKIVKNATFQNVQSTGTTKFKWLTPVAEGRGKALLEYLLSFNASYLILAQILSQGEVGGGIFSFSFCDSDGKFYRRGNANCDS